MVGVAKNVERGYIELQVGGDRDVGPNPRDRHGSQDVPMRKRERPFGGIAEDHLDEELGSRVDLRGRLAPWTAIVVELPTWMRLVDLLGGQAFESAVIELLEQWHDLRSVVAGELRGAQGALHRARVNRVELDALKAGAEIARVFFATRGQRNIGDSGVTPGKTPLGLAVASEIELEAQAGLPIISGRPDRNERLALSITAPARTRCPGRTQTSPTAA